MNDDIQLICTRDSFLCVSKSLKRKFNEKSTGGNCRRVKRWSYHLSNAKTHTEQKHNFFVKVISEPDDSMKNFVLLRLLVHCTFSYRNWYKTIKA